MGDLDDKVVLISGTGGIGKVTAKRFLQEGAKVFIADINPEGLASAAKELSIINPSIYWKAGDVSKVSDCEQMVKWVVDKAGRLDVLVNTAGVWVEGNSDEMTEEMWDRTININLKGTFFTCRYAIPELEKTEGCIVNISSDAGLVGNAGAAIYCASKGGVTLLTRALAIELAERRIRVNAVCPGDVETPMLIKQDNDYADGDSKKYDSYMKTLLSHYPQGKYARFTQPEEVAETIFFLASPKVGAITGAAISIDLGVTAGY